MAASFFSDWMMHHFMDADLALCKASRTGVVSQFDLALTRNEIAHTPRFVK